MTHALRHPHAADSVGGSIAHRVGRSKMKRSTASRCAFAILVAAMLLPVCGYLLNGSPEMVFYMGATAFMIGIVGPPFLLAAHFKPLEGSPPVVKRFRFTIRDLLCLTTVLFGMTMFFVSSFKCEAAERASRPNPVPTVVFRQFVWELEAGLVCMTIGGLIWIHSALKRSKE
jgi:hypothetical protein